MKFVFRVQIFHPGKYIWRMFECVAVSERQALKLATLANPGWVVRYAKKVIK